MIVKTLVANCTHCGLEVPKGLVDPRHEEQFCCSGCRSAWQLIHANGLDAFYSMVDSDADDRANSKYVDESSYSEFDEPGFYKKFVTVQPGGRATVTLGLGGLHCAACVWLIEKLPTMVPGILDAKVNWTKSNVKIAWHTHQVNLSKVARTLSKLGYQPHPAGKNTSTDLRQIENRKQLAQIGIAAAAAGNNMLIAAALYLGMFSYMSGSMETLLRVASCLVGLASFLGPGRVFLKGAFNSLRTRTPHMDLPIALALTVGSIAGLINTIRGSGEIYFDSLSVLICLLLIGRWVQFRQQYRAADAVELLYRMTPRRAMKLVNHSFVEVPADEIQIGDTIQIRPGDVIAADGIVLTGSSSVDESILTGESQPVVRSQQDDVFAGTKNYDGILTARVTAVDQQTRIHNVIQLVEDAASNKPEIVLWANRIGGYFVITVIVLSFVTLAGWLFFSPDRAVDRVVALLVVACPCALAMATPLAISVALGKLARNNILVKAGDVLQQLNRVGTVWFDKTGTLTEGELHIARWVGDEKWFLIAAQIEQHFNHPVAQAFCRDFDSSKRETAEQDPISIETIESVTGGASALVDGQKVLIGNRGLLQSHRIEISPEWTDEETAILKQHRSPCWMSVDGQIVALASLGDTIRTNAKRIVGDLIRAGWDVGILSGDHETVVASVAEELGIEKYHAAVTPEEKLQIIQQACERCETVMMVGDGVNDSAALAAADVGISIQGSAEASLAAAPVYLARSGLHGIEQLLRTAKSCSRTMRINIAASLAYNVVGVTLAMVGVLNPLVAAILMPISSITVITFSLTAAKD